MEEVHEPVGELGVDQLVEHEEHLHLEEVLAAQLDLRDLREAFDLQVRHPLLFLA